MRVIQSVLRAGGRFLGEVSMGISDLSEEMKNMVDEVILRRRQYCGYCRQAEEPVGEPMKSAPNCMRLLHSEGCDGRR